MRPSERRVMRVLISGGGSSRDVAKELNISKHTYLSHSKSIMRKMNTESILESVMKALKDRVLLAEIFEVAA